MELPLFWNEMYLTVRRDDPEPLPGAAVGPVYGHCQWCLGAFVTNACATGLALVVPGREYNRFIESDDFFR